MEGPSSITRLLVRWGQGDRTALAELTPHVQRELHALARSYLKRRPPNQTLQPTALINEAWLRLIDHSQSLEWENRAHFYGMAATIMRNVLVDYARGRKAARRGGAAQAVTLDEKMLRSDNRAPDIIELSEALDELAKVDGRKAKVIELRYFGGMDREEISTALGLTVATVKRDLQLGTAWLRAFLLS
jgi:RNA polymerase sigma factor (TIGR02999 family)